MHNIKMIHLYLFCQIRRIYETYVTLTCILINATLKSQYTKVCKTFFLFLLQLMKQFDICKSFCGENVNINKSRLQILPTGRNFLRPLLHQSIMAGARKSRASIVFISKKNIPSVEKLFFHFHKQIYAVLSFYDLSQLCLKSCKSMILSYAMNKISCFYCLFSVGYGRLI